MSKDQNTTRNNIIKDIYLLYELALSIGQSIDLNENCERFCHTLITKKNLDFVSIWLKDSVIPKKSTEVKDGFSLVYGNPKFFINEKFIPSTHLIGKNLKQSRLWATNTADLNFKLYIQETGVTNGAYAFFKLGDIGFLKLFSAHLERFEQQELKILENVINKFTVSIAGCLYHEQAIYEAENKLRIQESLNEKDKLYKAVVENMHEGLVITDTRDKVIFANRRMEELTGFSLSEMKGKIAYKLFLDKKDWPNLEERITERLDGNPESYEVEQIRKDGTKYWSMINASPYKNHKGEIIGTLGAVTDITHQRISNQKIRESETKTRLIIESALDAVIIIDMQGLVINWNDQAEKTFGWLAEEAMGKLLSDLIIPHELRAAHEKGMEHYRQTTEGPVLNKRIELTALHKMEHTFPVEIAIVPIELEETTLFSAFIRDITKQKNAKEELIKARQKAEASAIAKESFLANMSHEIRTPMNAIVGVTDLMAKTQLDKKQLKYTQLIKKSSNNLLVILEDILHLSKIESGKLNIESIGFNLKDQVEFLMDTLNPEASGKGILLDYSFDNSISEVVIGDPHRLQQILINLINNAIKFTKEGKVSLKVLVDKVSRTQQLIQFTVSDTGIGIDAAKLEHIFESFTQADESITRRFGGTGLGLAICKQLITLMGGSISVSSVKGEGTNFKVLLPFNIGSTKDLLNDADEIDRNINLTGIKVLLAEDNDVNRFLAETLLTDAGADVKAAINGLEAVNMVQEENYHVILMDMQMPEMSGIEATIHIRTKLKNDIPIIALTANAVEGDAKLCLDSGMNDYVSKPFDPDILFNKIAKLVRTNSDSYQHKISKENLAPDSPQKEKIMLESKEKETPIKKEYFKKGEQLYSLAKLETMSKGNPEFVKRMVEIFLKRTPDAIDQLVTHLQEKNWARIGSIAHQLKPSYDFMDIKLLVNTIREIEKNGKEEKNLDEMPELIEKLCSISKQVFEDLEKENF